MFGFIKNIFFSRMTFLIVMYWMRFHSIVFQWIIQSVKQNQKQKILTVTSLHFNLIFYSIEVNKCSDSCNNINDAYAKLCVLDAFKDMKIIVFNLMSRTNERRHINALKLVNVDVD